MSIRVEALVGPAMAHALPALARLRIEVFRDFPYLYDGTLDYEAGYLERLASSKGAVIVGAFDGDDVVGCATAMPMAEEHPEFLRPVLDFGLDPEKIYYLAESVLRTHYRGQGIGHRFFDLREEQARRLGGFRSAMFCGVVRPDDHPARPVGYRPLDPFWRKRGYAPVDGLVGSFTWRDVGEVAATGKPMQFWMKQL
ncbi:MAG: GNAT family N-acetyltransferase [Geminicoccaceae bacterium]|nr:GNAT family N-acetyltransferase [Geminicoccaceae bacterium]